MGSKLRVAACIMYVNALFGWWRPGGSTCDSAPRSGRARADGGGGRVRHPATDRQRGLSVQNAGAKKANSLSLSLSLSLSYFYY
jgi:hypothetical protein